MPRDRKGGRNPEGKPEQRGAGRHNEAVQRVVEEVVASEQLDEVVERRGEEKARREGRHLGARFEGRQKGPGDRQHKDDQHDRELDRISDLEDLAPHHVAAFRRRAKIRTDPNTIVDSVTMMVLA